VRRAILIATVLLAASAQVHAQPKEKLIPRSYPERCQYYLVKSDHIGNVLQVTTKQVCPKNEFYSGIGYSVTEIDCKRRVFREMGYGDDSVENIKMDPAPTWTKLVEGSSRSDLVNFVCK